MYPLHRVTGEKIDDIITSFRIRRLEIFGRMTDEVMFDGRERDLGGNSWNPHRLTGIFRVGTPSAVFTVRLSFLTWVSGSNNVPPDHTLMHAGIAFRKHG